VRRFFDDEKERRKWQNPEAILTDVGVKPGLIIMAVAPSSLRFQARGSWAMKEESTVWTLILRRLTG